MRIIRFAVICLVSILVGNVAHARPDPDKVYHERLYYTGKVWGFVKYFHSEVANGSVNWDSSLIESIPNVKASVTNKDFNNALLAMLDMAGEMALPTTSLPDLPDSLKYNLDLSWLDDKICSREVRARLDTIRVRFRPQSNVFVGEAYTGGNPTFGTDGQFYGSGPYPGEDLRLLALFRYWNIISYFFPYKYMMDQNWDSTLVEFIPKIVDAQDEMSFHLSFLELTTRLNDTHAFTFSSVINDDIVGSYYLPLTLQHIENETVVTGVFDDNTSIEIGDIIKSIKGIDIYTLRDSLRTYVAGSNNPVIERNINDRILSGPNEFVEIVLENSEGQKSVTLRRNVFTYAYTKLIEKTDAIWSILDTGSGRYGYVDMGRLKVADIETMFDDLWDTDGIVFDIRNYPQGTMWYMINYLFDAPIHMAKFTVPDIEYPGTLFWNLESVVGTGDFSQTYGNDIFILFDERTQSQAEYTVMALEQHPKAIKIGSQTAGADGNVSITYLPGGIATYFTGLGVFYPDYTETQRIGIVPDVEIHPTIAGIREGRDELLEAAIQGIPASSASLTYNNSSNPSQLPDAYLFQNYPNPFNPSTEISFSLPQPCHVNLEVFNIKGQRITTLVNRQMEAGNHTVSFGGSKVASGIYLYRINAGDFVESKKMILIK